MGSLLSIKTHAHCPSNILCVLNPSLYHQRSHYIPNSSKTVNPLYEWLLLLPNLSKPKLRNWNTLIESIFKQWQWHMKVYMQLVIQWLADVLHVQYPRSHNAESLTATSQTQLTVATNNNWSSMKMIVYIEACTCGNVTPSSTSFACV